MTNKKVSIEELGNSEYMVTVGNLKNKVNLSGYVIVSVEDYSELNYSCVDIVESIVCVTDFDEEDEFTIEAAKYVVENSKFDVQDYIDNA